MKSSGCIIDLVIDHTIGISKYNPLAGRSYIKLPKELDHPRKVLISIQNIDGNECLKCCLVRSVNLAGHNRIRITRADKDFARKLEFKDIKLLLKTRDIHKNEKKKKKKKIIGISIFDYENKKRYPIYVSKKCSEENPID